MRSFARLVRHLGRVTVDVVRYGSSTRRFVLVVAVALGILVVALAIGASTTAPFVLYPFA